jgi:hypothetical protein
MSREAVATIVAAAPEIRAEPPRPLMRELPRADLYPVDALGDMLAGAARAIHDRVQAPLAICGQSVLAAATLSTQGHADVVLPTDQARPISSYFVSVAATGERKSAVDADALAPVRQREATLRKLHETEHPAYVNALEAFNAARGAEIKKLKGDRAALETALRALSPEPKAPLLPILTCPEPTYEGLCRLLAVAQPSIGIFAAEGGQFIGGHGMSDEAKLRTSAGLSACWDGEPIKRVRAQDGLLLLPGRRVSMHLMAQPDVAAMWLGDRLLLDQGLLSRVLVTAPNPASGTRLWRDPSIESTRALEGYNAIIGDILRRQAPLAPGARNELAPRRLLLSGAARAIWIGFADHIERRLGSGGELDSVRGLANKLPEHAARIAGVLTLVSDLDAGEISAGEMKAGIAIAEHFATEALRLSGASRISTELIEAQRLLNWLLTSWPKPVVSLPDIYRLGPNSIRDKASAQRAVTILCDHGWLANAPSCEINGVNRREVWLIIRG